ncbi:unnamed protein product, partial [Ectocarpus sp. 8 AP-2014]
RESSHNERKVLCCRDVAPRGWLVAWHASQSTPPHSPAGYTPHGLRNPTILHLHSQLSDGRTKQNYRSAQQPQTRQVHNRTQCLLSFSLPTCFLNSCSIRCHLHLQPSSTDSLFYNRSRLVFLAP